MPEREYAQQEAKAARERWEETVKGAREATRVPLGRAAQMLGLDEARVMALGGQGRLTMYQVGTDWHCDTASVHRMRAEDLIRELVDGTRDAAPGLEPRIEELAALQYMRGRIAGIMERADQRAIKIGDRLHAVAEDIASGD